MRSLHLLHSTGFFLLDEAGSFHQYRLLEMLIAMLSGRNQALWNRDAKTVEQSGSHRGAAMSSVRRCHLSARCTEVHTVAPAGQVHSSLCRRRFLKGP